MTNITYILDTYFEDWVMSVHFVAWQKPIFKGGKPWWWTMSTGKNHIDIKEIESLANNLLQEVNTIDDAFLEISKNYSKVLQIGPYRVVIVYPPLSKRLEITAVRPVTSRTLEQYNLEESVKKNLLEDARGILITWAPGEGKSTFATAYVNELSKKDVVIKTIESPRDLQVDETITQYSFSHAPHNEIRDILLLSRPDYSIYDEVRNKEDFLLFKDLRLTWIGLIWVMHATKAIDWIQRMIWTIELWLIPQIIDTVIYIKWWEINQIYTLEQTVKTPLWMTSDDLARPVILVKDLIWEEVRYEMYSYGDSVVVMPVDMIEASINTKNSNAIQKYAKRWLQEYFANELRCKVAVEIEWSNRILVYVPSHIKPRFIWKAWSRIQEIEKELWLSIWVREISEYGWKNTPDTDSLPYKIHEIHKGKKTILQIVLWKEFAHQEVSCMIWSDLMTFVANHAGIIQIRRKKLIDEIQTGDFAVVQ